jgi:molecular chaperone DnaK (HSP70)
MPDPPSPIVGIDLGTTNCAVAWVDPGAGARARPQVFQIPQLVAPHEVGERPILPSFLYLPTDDERDSGAVALPWHARPQHVAGVYARDHGALVPVRQISSAKSWLSNPLVDRRAAILPAIPEAPERLSPVDASARLLAHIRDAWNHARAGADASMRLERLPIVLTVPASFDEEARELTVEAAHEVGLDRLTLLEEPLAALYAWMAAHGGEVEATLGAGRTLLICDVGGGTTDFSLIQASTGAEGVQFERTAIGEHLLLGGDNLDLALAADIEHQLAGPPHHARLTLTQRHTLRRHCSAAKEQLLADGAAGQVALTVLGSGRSVVGGALTASLTRDRVRAALDAFLPPVQPGDLPARGSRAGLRELGLPYETDPAITRHLAAFLARASRESGSAGGDAPDAVLFNGGFFAAAAARARVLDALERLVGRRPEVLENAAPEAAVALGAARYGALRGAPHTDRRLLVRAGSARAYYVGLQDEADRLSAVCVMPRGTEEGSTLLLDRDLVVVANQPAAFTLFSSLERTDALGDVVVFSPAEPVHRHAALVTALRYGQRSRRLPLTVRLRIVFTEVGTLELWCESLTTEHRWRLQFNLRAIDADDRTGPAEPESADATHADSIVIAESAVANAEGALRVLFTGAAGAASVEGITSDLENMLGHGRHAWPLGVIRRLADVLLSVAEGRRASARHEARWLNLAGFCLRPGFGAPTDPWRIGEIRKVYATGPAFPKDTQVQVEWLVLWQRVAAGFGGGQQQELARRMTGLLGLGAKKGARLNPQILREAWRLLGNLERLDAGQRARLGEDAVTQLTRDPAVTALAWTVGRFGARTPLYGPLSSVVPPQAVERWLGVMLGFKRLTGEAAAAMVQMAALTGDPVRDVGDAMRERVRQRLTDEGIPEAATAPLREVVPVERQDRARLFGEALPEGLRISPP